MSTQDRQSFINRIKAEPADIINYQVFADWLEEQNDPRADYIRTTFATTGMNGIEGFGFPAAKLYSREAHALMLRQDAIVQDVYDIYCREAGVTPVTSGINAANGDWYLHKGLLASVRITDVNRASFFACARELGERLPILAFTPQLNSHLTAAEYQVLRDLPIEVISINQNSQRNAAHLEPLSLLPHLKVLNLTGYGFSSQDFAGVATIPGLNRFSASKLRRLENHDLAAFQGNKTIEHLILQDSGAGFLTATGLDYLKGMPLKTLDLSGHPIGIREAEVIAGFTDLEVLRLHGCRMTDAVLTRLTAALPNLKELGVSSNHFQTSGGPKGWVTAISKLKDLEVLVAEGNKIGGHAFRDELSQLTNLAILNLHNARLSLTIVDGFAAFPELRFLEIGRSVLPITNHMHEVNALVDMVKDGRLPKLVYLPEHVRQADSNLYSQDALIELHNAREAKAAAISDDKATDPTAPKTKWLDRVQGQVPGRKLTRKMGDEGPSGMAL